jgi:hypothetical protein
MDAEDPFGGTPDNWTRDPWPPTDADELAALDRYCDQCDAELAEWERFLRAIGA